VVKLPITLSEGLAKGPPERGLAPPTEKGGRGGSVKIGGGGIYSPMEGVRPKKTPLKTTGVILEREVPPLNESFLLKNPASGWESSPKKRFFTPPRLWSRLPREEGGGVSFLQAIPYEEQEEKM